MAIAEHSLATPPPHPLPWTKDQYYQMAELGWFEGKRVELIEGEIFRMSPIGARHVRAVNVVSQVLQRVFGDAFYLSIQNPFDAGEDSEPMPDIVVIAGDPRSSDAIPATAALLVEVSDTTLSFDRNAKARVYARAGVADYWIVNLVDNQIEVHRQPDPAGEYAQVRPFRAGETLVPLAAPQAVIAVSDLLP